jgi:hypothetical protein
VYVAVAVAIAGAITVVEIGINDQHSRHLPTVQSASVWKVTRQSPPRLVVRVSRAGANRLASQLDSLPQFPSGDMSCGADFGRAYLVHFRTDNGSTADVHIDLGGCLTVEASSGGTPWGWEKWDPHGTAYAEIRSEVQRGRNER